MASKKKHTKGKKKPVPAKPKPKSKPKSKPQPIVAVIVPAVTVPLTAPPIVISYDLVAKRAFEIWQRKLHTNYPEHNWREAEEELRVELLGTRK